ncbi:MAG TPA: DNA polymerase III subunit delta [Acidimicrobiales bacterium]|nr:DNA polymerase III subunit delta [Acidimicrobiales bacterium]
MSSSELDVLGAWLVTGEDPALVAEAVARLVMELVGGTERSLVVEDFSGEELELAAVVDACSTPPFLAGRRVVVVRDAGRFGGDALAPLISYLDDPMPTTKLVVAGGGGQLPTKFVNAFKQSPLARVVPTDVSSREAHGWVAERLARASVKLAAPAAALVEAHLGEDLNRLSSILAVLEAAYGPGARVGEAELAPYLGQPGSVPPWDLTDAIDQGDVEAALRLLHRLLDAGARHPLVVLAILQRHFANVLRVQSPSMTSEAQAAEALGIPKGRSTFPAKKALDAARRLGPSGSGEAIILLAGSELALKGKLEWKPDLVLEVLVARLCRLSRAARGGAAAGARAGSARAGGTGSGRV